MKATSRHRMAVLLIPGGLALLSVFLIPLLTFFSNSFHAFADLKILPGWTLATYAKFFGDPFYWQTVLNSVTLGIVVTVITLVVAYPAALIMARMRGSRLFMLMALAVFSPLLVSVIVRAYGWLLVLSESGVVNFVLVQLGIIREPVRLIFNWTGVIVSIVHIEMPFMLFPILSVLLQLPPEFDEAARDLGANTFHTWKRVTLPLSVPGILAGCQIVFTTTISAFASPTLLGGGRVRVMPVLIYQNILGLNWPMGAVMSIVLLGLSLALVSVFSRLLRTRGLWSGRMA